MMTEARRMLMLIIIDDHPSIPAMLYHIDRFHRCDEICRWLINNHLIGKKFIDWVRFEHKNSILSAGAFVLSKLEKAPAPRPVIGIKDYRLN